MNWAEITQLYNAAGQHIGGVFPPLMVDNVLTDVHRAEAAQRPFISRVAIDPRCTDLAFVWMLPFGCPKYAKVAPEAVGVAVAALDQGRLVILHGDTQQAVDDVGTVLALFIGGGHA